MLEGEKDIPIRQDKTRQDKKITFWNGNECSFGSPRSTRAFGFARPTPSSLPHSLNNGDGAACARAPLMATYSTNTN